MPQIIDPHIDFKVTMNTVHARVHTVQGALVVYTEVSLFCSEIGRVKSYSCQS